MAQNAGDLTGQLIAFFGPTAGLKWSEDVKLLKVLKVGCSPSLFVTTMASELTCRVQAVNQEVLAPPVLKMKMDVHKHLAYKVLAHRTVSRPSAAVHAADAYAGHSGRMDGTDPAEAGRGGGRVAREAGAVARLVA
jgi:hypothetical protein